MGQEAEKPVQYSARSQLPVFGLQTLPVGLSCIAERNTDGDVPNTEIRTLGYNQPDGTVRQCLALW